MGAIRTKDERLPVDFSRHRLRRFRDEVGDRLRAGCERGLAYIEHEDLFAAIRFWFTGWIMRSCEES
jgi:hypothetical protein